MSGDRFSFSRTISTEGQYYGCLASSRMSEDESYRPLSPLRLWAVTLTLDDRRDKFSIETTLFGGSEALWWGLAALLTIFLLMIALVCKVWLSLKQRAKEVRAREASLSEVPMIEVVHDVPTDWGDRRPKELPRSFHMPSRQSSAKSCAGGVEVNLPSRQASSNHHSSGSSSRRPLSEATSRRPSDELPVGFRHGSKRPSGDSSHSSRRPSGDAATGLSRRSSNPSRALSRMSSASSLYSKLGEGQDEAGELEVDAAAMPPGTVALSYLSSLGKGVRQVLLPSRNASQRTESSSSQGEQGPAAAPLVEHAVDEGDEVGAFEGVRLRRLSTIDSYRSEEDLSTIDSYRSEDSDKPQQMERPRLGRQPSLDELIDAPHGALGDDTASLTSGAPGRNSFTRPRFNRQPSLDALIEALQDGDEESAHDEAAAAPPVPAALLRARQQLPLHQQHAPIEVQQEGREESVSDWALTSPPVPAALVRARQQLVSHQHRLGGQQRCRVLPQGMLATPAQGRRPRTFAAEWLEREEAEMQVRAAMEDAGSATQAGSGEAGSVADERSQRIDATSRSLNTLRV